MKLANLRTAWTWDAFDFFTVSLTVTEIAKDFGVANSQVSWVSNLKLEDLRGMSKSNFRASLLLSCSVL